MKKTLLTILLLAPAAAFGDPPAETPAERFQRFLGDSSKAFQALGMYSAAGPSYEVKDGDQMGLAPAAVRPSRGQTGTAPGRRPRLGPYYKDQDQQEPGEADRCPAPPARRRTQAAPASPAQPYPSKDADQMPPAPPPPADTSKDAEQRQPARPCPTPPANPPPADTSKDADQRQSAPPPPPPDSKGQGL